MSMKWIVRRRLNQLYSFLKKYKEYLTLFTALGQIGVLIAIVSTLHEQKTFNRHQESFNKILLKPLLHCTAKPTVIGSNYIQFELTLTNVGASGARLIKYGSLLNKQKEVHLEDFYVEAFNLPADTLDFIFNTGYSQSEFLDMWFSILDELKDTLIRNSILLVPKESETIITHWLTIPNAINSGDVLRYFSDANNPIYLHLHFIFLDEFDQYTNMYYVLCVYCIDDGFRLSVETATDTWLYSKYALDKQSNNDK